MSGDGTDRGGSGLPDDSADGTDWLLSQLDADDTEAIETQPDDEEADRASAPPVVTDPGVTPAESAAPAPAPAPAESTPAPAWTPVPESAPAAASTPVSEPSPVAASAPAPESTPAPGSTGALRHPNALELPVVPPTPAPAAPIPPARNELTVDTDSVLQHAPAGTFRPAPTNPVVLPPVDDEPWSLGASDDDARPAAEDVSTMALPTARALAADDPEAWAAVDAEHATPATDTPARPGDFDPAPNTEPAAPQPVDAPLPPAATFGAQPVEPTSAPAVAGSDDDLPEGSWSLSETFGDDVLGGETVEVRDRDADADAADAAPDQASTAGDATASAPRTDPLAWLTEPFGETFGASQTAPAAQSSDAADPVFTDAAPDLADPLPAQPWSIETEPHTDAVSADAVSADAASEPVDTVDDSLAAQPAPIEPETVTEPAPDATASSAPVTPAAPFRWDTVVAAPTPDAPSSPAEVPWPETVPDASAEPLDETRPFDSLGGPGFSALGGAAAGQPFPADPEPVVSDGSADVDGPVDDAAATETSEVPPAFGPPTPQAERSITELISLDGVQPEPTVSPFGSAPFVWDLAPNDALDPLVHAAPTTQPIPVPAVQWEGTDAPAVSAESPSELALEGEVPDAAFIAGDVQPFAPGLAAETLGRPLVDGPGDEFASWRDDAVDDDDAATTPAVVPAANDTVDLFPTLSLGGLDASLDAAAAAGGLGAHGAFGAGATVPGRDLDERASDDTEDAPASVDPAPSSTETTSPAGFAVDPEELDDEFDAEIVQFDAVPLSAAAATPLTSFAPDADATDATDAVDADTTAVTEPEPVSEELRLESLFDVGPDTETVEVPVSDGGPSDTETTDGPASAAPSAPSEQAGGPAPEAASSDSLADAFAAEGGWSLQADTEADPEPPLAETQEPVDGTDPVERSTDDPAESGAHRAGEHDAGPAPAHGAALGAHAAAVPSQGPATHPVQTAPAALPGETVAFPELDGANGFVTPAAAAGIVGATLPPQPTTAPSPTQRPATPTSVRDRDLPEYRGEPLDQSIPKALLWAVVGLAAAVLLLLAFYFGTLVGAANAAGASGAAGVTTPSTASSLSSGTPEAGSA